MTTVVVFTVRGRMPTQNELIELRARSPHAYNARKKKAAELVMFAASKITQTFDRVAVELTLLEQDTRIDPDNVACGALKVILDALQRAGVLKNDGWDNIESIQFSWATSPEGPAVRVAITGEENGSTTARQRRIEFARREHRAKATRAKKAAHRAQHHSVDGQPARVARNAGGKAARLGVSHRRR